MMNLYKTRITALKTRRVLVLFMVMTAFSTPKAMACDSCNFFEYSLLENKSYLGVFYRYRHFNDYREYGFPRTSGSGNSLPLRQAQMSIGNDFPDFSVMHEPEGNGLYVNKTRMDFENYHTVEVRGNVTFKNKWNVTFLLPYEYNRVHYEELLILPNPVQDTTINVQGWGDLTLAADYIHFVYNKKARHTFRPGLAITAPTGEGNKVAAVRMGEAYLFDPIIQPGTGSWSVIGRFNYQLFFEKDGINAGLSYKKATEGAQNYRFGNSFNAYLLYFRQMETGGDILMVPNAGVYLEQANRDKREGEIQPLTGGNVGFGQVGLDINRKQNTVNFLLQVPVFQNLNGNQIRHQERISIGFIRSFKI